MKSTRARVVLSIVRDFCINNKKSVISFLIVFVVGMVIGIVSTLSYNGGEFQTIARVNMEFGAVKVFFMSSLIIAGGYFIIVISSFNSVTAFMSLIIFGIFGFFLGKYMCLLIACYEIIGLINLFLIYLPFFLMTFCCFMVAAVEAVLAPSCGGSGAWGRINPSLITALKIYGVNVALNFVVFVIIGALTKVIVIPLNG